MDFQGYKFSNVFPNLFISILKFSGMLPMELYKGASKVTLGHVAYSLCLLLVCLVVLTLSIPVVQYFEDVREGPGPEVIINTTRGHLLTKFVKVFYPMVMCCTSIVAILNSLWRYKNCLPKYLQYLYECDVYLKKGRVLSESHKQFAMYFITCCLGFSIPVKLFSVTSLALMHVLNEYVTFWVIFLFFIDMIGFIVEIQFVLMSNSLRIRFNAINETLENLFSPHDIKLEYRIKSFTDKWTNRKKLYNTDITKSSLSHITLSKYLVKKMKARNKKVTLKSTLKTVPIVVAPLEDDDMVSSVATVFASEFASLSDKTVFLTESDYSSRLHSLRLSHRHLCIALYFLKVMFEFDVTFWILKSVLRFTFPLIISEATANSASKTLVILSGNACQTFSRKTQEELRYFCQEVASRNVTVSCAFDLFVLRANLVTAAVAAITTYTVILVQLHK